MKNNKIIKLVTAFIGTKICKTDFEWILLRIKLTWDIDLTLDNLQDKNKIINFIETVTSFIFKVIVYENQMVKVIVYKYE